MTNATHAAAPWSVGGRYQYKTVLMDANGNSIASGGNNRAIRDEELEASLVLAAAAPDMLTALSEIASGHLPAAYPMTERGLIDYHVATARAAIAKTST